MKINRNCYNTGLNILAIYFILVHNLFAASQIGLDV